MLCKKLSALNHSTISPFFEQVMRADWCGEREEKRWKGRVSKEGLDEVGGVKKREN